MDAVPHTTPRQESFAASHRRFLSLDGLRGVAILLVVAYHVGGGASSSIAPVRWLGEVVKQGWIGVLLFFVLSGFLITGILWDSREHEHWLRNFYARRALRILPLYYFALLLMLGGAWWAGTLHTALLRVWSPALFLQDFPGLPAEYLRHNYSPLPILHLWSLAVEEQFYLVWPFLLLLARSKRAALLLCGIVFTIATCTGIAQTYHPALAATLPLVVPHAAEIAAGAWLAIAFRTSHWRRLTMPANLLAPLGIALFALAAIYPRALGSIANLAITIGFAALVVLALQPGWIAQSLSGSAIRWLGKLSYGIYVYHVLLWPLFKHAAIALSGSTRGTRYELILATVRIGATLLVAWASFRLLELPFLRLKRFFPVSPLNTPQQRPASEVRRPIR